MEMQKLLRRQLDKLGINYDELPPNLETWQAFLSSINKTYLEADQDRYLLERSMDISSREMMSINEQLQKAQALASLCYWQFNLKTGIISWSKGIYDILNINPRNPPPSSRDFFNWIYPDDKPILKIRIEKAIFKKIDFDFEIRIKTQENVYQWFRVIIKPGDKQNELSGIIININAKKESELKIKELNRALLTAARQAGMSEVATTILHNIGNLLTSSNVSMSIIKQNLEHDYHKKLAALVSIMHENSHQLNDYLLHDQKGKLILPYLEKLSKELERVYLINNEEVDNLEKKLNHIKEIVAMQQSISGISRFYEEIFISELLDNSFEISNIENSKINIKIEIDKNVKTIFSDKSKLLQILTNLLRNAKDAVLESTVNEKKINIIANNIDQKQIKIVIKDNGIGIAAENIDKIFTFGFTTKISGHGFGLHSSALSAKELGGSLEVTSPGIEKGTEFTLLLPLKRE